MEKGVRKKTERLAIGVAIVCLCACVGANATILHVQDVQLATPGQFYTYSAGSGSLLFSNKSISVQTLIFDDGSSDYSITSAKLTLSSALVTDTSSNNIASGLFQGGGILTLTGTLKTKSGITILPANSTLLVANMDITSSQTWLLQELPATTINGTVYFSPNTTVGLGMGVVYGNDTLKLDQFRLDFSFKGLSPNPNNFTTGNISGTSSTIGIEAIPEPSTILLFTTAALAAFRIKKK